MNRTLTGRIHQDGFTPSVSHDIGHAVHDGHAVLGVRQGTVLRRVTWHRQSASDSATATGGVMALVRPDEEAGINGWDSWPWNLATTRLVDEEHACAEVVRIPALGTSPNRPAVSTVPMKLCADKPRASDGHPASALADEARFPGQALRVAVDDGPLLTHRAKHRRISRCVVTISAGLQPAS